MQTWEGGWFAQNRPVMFFWKLPGQRSCDVLLEWMLDRTPDVGKVITITQQTVDNPVALVHLAFFTDHLLPWLHRERHTKELLWYSRGFLLLPRTQADWQSLWIIPEETVRLCHELPRLIPVNSAVDILTLKVGIAQKNFF